MTRQREYSMIIRMDEPMPANASSSYSLASVESDQSQQTGEGSRNSVSNILESDSAGGNN